MQARRLLIALLILAVFMSLILTGCGKAPTPATTPAAPTSARLVPTFTATPTAVSFAAATQPPAAAATPVATRTSAPPPTATPTVAPLTATASPLPATATNPPAPTATPTTAATATPTARPATSTRSAPAPTATATGVPTRALAWDARLTKRGAVLIPAQVQPGQGYWRLVQAQWFDVNDAPFAGQHHIFVDALDQAGQRQVGVPIRFASPDARDIYGYLGTEAKPGEPYAGNFAMFTVAPAYRVEPFDGAPADAVTGLGLGNIEFPAQAMLTSYGFTWQWTVPGAVGGGAAAAGGGPDKALRVPADLQRLASGQRIWYRFDYAGYDMQIVVEMALNPPGAATFAIWTPADVQRWAEDGKESPVGRGTPNQAANGALAWIGNFNAAGVYYIVVDQTGPYTGSFTLTVTGPGVTL
jgi:hypothetical protein